MNYNSTADGRLIWCVTVPAGSSTTNNLKVHATNNRYLIHEFDHFSGTVNNLEANFTHTFNSASRTLYTGFAGQRIVWYEQVWRGYGNGCGINL